MWVRFVIFLLFELRIEAALFLDKTTIKQLLFLVFFKLKTPLSQDFTKNDKYIEKHFQKHINGANLQVNEIISFSLATILYCSSKKDRKYDMELRNKIFVQDILRSSSQRNTTSKETFQNFIRQK